MSELTDGRIAWFTPLRPASSGISLYNEELLAILGAFWPIDVFVDGYSPDPFEPFGKLRVFPANRFNRLDRRDPYATVVYQFGNSPAHAYMFDVALRHPGVLVLHDTVLHHLRLSMIARRGGAARYRRAMERDYGEDGRMVAEQVLRGRLSQSLFDYPLSEELIQVSKQVVVHSEFSREQVRRLVPDANVNVVPMGIPIPPLIDHQTARSALGLRSDAFIVASITAVNPYKRLDVVLRAINQLRRSTPVYLLIAGNVSPHVPLERWIALYGLEGVVERLGFVDDRTARLVAAAADVLVNLRYPTAGETSASLLRLMAAGRPVLVSDAGSFRELPDDTVAKVAVNFLEEETVAAFLASFAGDPELARQLGASARSHIERQHTLRHMVVGYYEVLNDAGLVHLPMPSSAHVTEDLDMNLVPALGSFDPLYDATGTAIVELGLGGDERLLQDVASAMAEIGLEPDKM